MKGRSKTKGLKKMKIEHNSEPVTSYQNYSSSDLGIFEYTSFTNVIQRRNDRSTTLSDLKAVQYTLEHMLVGGMRKRRQFESKINNLENLQYRKDKRSKSTDSMEKKDERPPKKAKDSTSKASSGQARTGAFISTSYMDPTYESLRLPKDGPARFWSIIEPYCADITQDTIRMLEDWISPHESDEKFCKIPELGKHYSEKWREEDIKEEMKEGSKSVENNKGLFADTAQDNEEVKRVLSMSESEKTLKEVNQDCSLRDRIVCTLVGENLMTPMHENLSQACLDDDEEVDRRTNPNALPSPAPTRCETLEERLMKDFFDEGLLDEDDVPLKVEDDEVLTELKRLQNALIPVQEYNLKLKRKLLLFAKTEMVKQETKKKLQEYDAKVMEIYRNVSAARKNGTMNKKLEDQVKRTLRERKKIIEKLNSIE